MFWKKLQMHRYITVESKKSTHGDLLAAHCITWSSYLHFLPHLQQHCFLNIHTHSAKIRSFITTCSCMQSKQLEIKNNSLLPTAPGVVGLHADVSCLGKHQEGTLQIMGTFISATTLGLPQREKKTNYKTPWDFWVFIKIRGWQLRSRDSPGRGQPRPFTPSKLSCPRLSLEEHPSCPLLKQVREQQVQESKREKNIGPDYVSL